jgi:hypothetical protein
MILIHIGHALCGPHFFGHAKKTNTYENIEKKKRLFQLKLNNLLVKMTCNQVGY